MRDADHSGSPAPRPVFGWRLGFGGLTVGTVFALLSITPSLLPRGWVTQGVVTGLAFVSGYAIGSLVSAGLRRFVLRREPTATLKRWSWRSLAAVAVLGLVHVSWRARSWQTELRLLVGLQPEPARARLYVVAVAVVVAALVLVVARSLRHLARLVAVRVGRYVPRAVAPVVGSVVVAVLLVGFMQGIVLRWTVSALEAAYSTRDGTSFEASVQPDGPMRSGSPGALSHWTELGREGRRFISEATSVEELEELGGDGCCVEPIRVYVGLKGGDTPAHRAELAVAELDRTHAFDREVLVIATPTGSGYVNPFAMGAIEYIHRGDSAIVSMQYSYMPSWLSVLLDEDRPGVMTRALWDAIGRRLERMPAAQRPMVLGFGESLGSFGLERGLATVEEMQDRSDGILLIGATHDNPVRADLTRGRVAGSPEWQPLSPVPGVFFAQPPADLPGPPVDGDPPRIIYLLNASDPVSWWNPSLLWSRPDWNDDRPMATDRSPAFHWRPIVTFWQMVGDLPGAGSVPAGHGHIFGSNTVDGWLAVDTPEGWTSADTARVREALDARFG